jgi:hypothetical protein
LASRCNTNRLIVLVYSPPFSWATLCNGEIWWE